MVWADCYCGTSKGLNDAEDDTETIVDALECDYEKDCTPLYKRIENAEWEDVAFFLDSGYWPGHFFKDSVSPADQARTWVTRFQPGGNGEQIKWSQLPLHLSIVVGAPFGVVRRLVAMYPKSVQCTDDEFMLPLHLAMRHGASDSVIDLFLEKFPMAVNARGKNNRTPIDCAFRSNKKARARILTAFIEQTQTLDGNEIFSIRSLLDEKELTINDLQSKLTTLEKEKTLTEFEMSQKVSNLLGVKLHLENQLEQIKHAKEQIESNLSKMIDEYQAAKLHEDIETNEKIKALEESANDLKEAASRIREEEEQLRSDLKKIEVTIENSSSVDGVKNLKVELERLRSDRLVNKRARTMEEMAALKESLIKNMENTDGKTQDEIKAMRQAIEDLQKREFSVQSNDELTSIKQELVSLKEELRTKREVSRTKADLFALKKSLNVALKARAGKDDAELESLRQVIEPMQISDLDSKNCDELSKIRTELGDFRMRLQSRQLTNELLRELAEIRITLTGQFKDSSVQRKKELEELLRTVECIQQKLATNSNHLDIKMEIVALKDQIKESEAQHKMTREIDQLKSTIEEAVKQVEGQKKKDLIAMKSAVEAIESKKHNSRNFVELLNIKKEFQEMKLNFVPRSEVTKVKEELALMKSMLAQQMKDNNGKTKEKLSAIQQSLEAIQVKRVENLKRLEFNDVKLEIVKMWKRMAEMEEVILAKEELITLKRQLSTDLSKAKGNNRKELLVVKHTIDSIDLDAIEIKNQDDWHALKKELEAVKIDLKKKELRALKRILENELKNPSKKSPEEIEIIKEASHSINLFALETATNSELNHLKSQIDAKLNKIASSGTKKKKGLFGLFAKRKQTASVPTTQKKTPAVKTLLPPRVQKSETSPSVVSDSSSEDDEILDDELYGRKEKRIVGSDGGVEVTRTDRFASLSTLAQ